MVVNIVSKNKHCTRCAVFEKVNQLITELGHGETPNIYVGLSKAFQKLKHIVLLHKLEHNGLKDICLCLFINNLIGRSQCLEYGYVKYNMLKGTTGGSTQEHGAWPSF